MNAKNGIFVLFCHLWFGEVIESTMKKKTALTGYSIGVQLNETDSKRLYLLLSFARKTTDSLASNETSWRFDFIISLFSHPIKCNQMAVIRICLLSVARWEFVILVASCAINGDSSTFRF